MQKKPIQIHNDEDIHIMDKGIGAELRVLQLERALQKAIIRGSLIIDYIDENTDADTANLETTLDELELLLNEVESIDIEQDKEELANQFLDIKAEARELIKQFKESAKESLSKDDVPALKELFENVDRTELEAINEQIADLKRQHNAERVQNMLEQYGVEDEELIEQIQNGEIDKFGVKQALKAYYADLSPEQKAEVRDKVKEHRKERLDFKKNTRIKHVSNKLGRWSDRADQRAEKLTMRADRAGDKGFEWREKRLDRQAKFFEHGANRLDMQKGNLQEKFNEVRQKRAEAGN